MHNISESIETIGSIINELSIDENKIAIFREQYKKISQRSKDTNFYLSAIGGFSSGKSTLINTLIRRKLLKTAYAATTAVPTYIYRGNDNHVIVKAKCSGDKQYNLTSEEDIKEFEKEFGTKLPQEIDEIISLLTADKELSSKIKEVDIELPNDELVNGLCIIDTPGINPGANYTENHAEITKYILNEKADAIIILFPADQAYTQSFEEFLRDNAEYFIKDAIFVVTMIDRVDEEERDDVLGFVRTNLRNNFRLKDPQVLSCSAILSGKDPYWASNFAEFEQSLMDTLAKNRQRIVTERLTKISNELLNTIQSEILSQKSGFEKRLSVLQNHSVPKLESVLTDSKTAAIDQLSKIQAEHDTAVGNEGSTLGNRIWEKVSYSLYACNSRSGVTKYVNEALTSDIEAVCRNIYETSATHTENLNNAVSSAIADMIDKLKTYYGEIGGVMPESTALAASEHHSDISGKLTGLGSLISSHETKIDGVVALGGAGLGALILTGLGPIGWIIGGAVALGAGDKLFVSSTREKVRASVYARVPEITKSVVEGLYSGMKSNYDNAMKALEAKYDELVAQYQPIYEKLEKQFSEEEQDLAQKIQHSKKTQDGIKAVLSEINQIQEGVIE